MLHREHLGTHKSTAVMPKKSKTVLTVKMCEQAKRPKTGVDETFDAAAPGMCLRVAASGRKTFIVTTRVMVGDKRVQRRYTLGELSDEFGLLEARAAASEIIEKAKAGEDPRPKPEPEPVSAPAAKTFGSIAEMYIKRKCPDLARGAEIDRMIRREILPRWGDRPIAELRKRDAIALTDALVDAGKPAAAYFLYEIVKSVTNWALDRDEIDASPFATMKPPVEKISRQRVLKHAEIKAVWPAFEGAGYPFGPLAQLLLLTGQRRSEVAGMRWAEVDLEAREWTIPAGRSKSAREHIVPLSDAAAAILTELPRFAGGDFVFSTTAGRRPVSGFSKMKARLDKRVEIEDWRLHDLRRTVRTELARLGVPEIVSERVINHGPKGLVAVYNKHEYADEKRDALDRWAGELRDIVTPPPANVVKLPAAGRPT